jgi:hypothetical protein
LLLYTELLLYVTSELTFPHISCDITENVIFVFGMLDFSSQNLHSVLSICPSRHARLIDS